MEFCKKKSGIVTNLANQIKIQIPELPLELIRCFAKTRVIVRMRYLNLKNDLNSRRKHKRRYPDPHAKSTKKMKKIVN